MCLRAATGLLRTEALRRLPNLFTQYFAPETGAHSERVSERRYVFRGSRSTDRSKNPRSIPSGILHRWLFRNQRTRLQRVYHTADLDPTKTRHIQFRSSDSDYAQASN